MTNSFTPIEILRPNAVEFGCGTVAAAARFAERIGARRPLVISDPFNARRVDQLALPGAVKVFGDVKPEPDLPVVLGELRVAQLDARLRVGQLSVRRRERHRHVEVRAPGLEGRGEDLRVEARVGRVQDGVGVVGVLL